MDNYKIGLVGGDKEPFLGYVSAIDPTLASPRASIAGSKNTYKKRTGTYAVREGLKRRGAGNTANTGIESSFEWETSFGITYPLRTVVPSTEGGSDGKLQFESTIADGTTPVWYDLLDGLSLTRFVFDTWWDADESKDTLLMVNGDTSIKVWSGGVAKMGSVSSNFLSYRNGGGTILTFSISSASPAVNIYYNGQLSANIAAGSIGLTSNPSDGDTIVISASDASTPVTAITVTFVAAIGATAGNVLIGPDVATTFANLFDLLQHPTSTTANHVAFGTNGATLIGDFAITQAYGILIEGDTTWIENGFSSNPTNSNLDGVTINGHQYTSIGGFDTNYLVVNSDPSAEPSGSIVVQTVFAFDNIPADNFVSDFLKVLSNQVYVGGYSSRIVYSSADDDYTDFVNGGAHVVGDPAFMVFDEQVRGLGEADGKLCVFAGLDLLYLVTPNVNVTYTYTGQDGEAVFAYNAVEKVPLSGKSSALAHEFIGNFGSYLVWLDQSNQLRALGTFTNNLSKQATYLSLDVWDDFKNENFNDGALRVVDDTIYITAPATGNAWFYQERQLINETGQITSEKLWQPPQEWDISRVALINGLTYGHSASNPDIYQLLDTNQWHDDTPSDDVAAPYKSQLIFGYSRDKRTNLISYTKIFFEGFILPNSPLNLDLFYDYQGASGIVNAVLQDGEDSMELFQALSEGKIGGRGIGGGEAGGGNNSIFPKFRIIGTTSPVNCFEYGVSLWSDTADSRWEILDYGTNATLVELSPTFINKRIS